MEKNKAIPPSVSHLLDMGSPTINVAHAKKYKEVELLQARVSAAHAAIDATVLITPRARSQKGNATCKYLIKKIKNFANKLKKKTTHHNDLPKGIDLERKKFEDMLK